MKAQEKLYGLMFFFSRMVLAFYLDGLESSGHLNSAQAYDAITITLETGENIHPKWCGWDTEAFTVIRHHHEAANVTSVPTSETTMNPDKTNKKRGGKPLAIRQHNI